MEERRWGLRRMGVTLKEGQGIERAVTNSIHE
jgi:hypothetical protein